MNPYIGHDSQCYGVEEHRLVGGKGDGMRIFEVNNGKGLELTVVPDKCGDIYRLRFKGINMSYMSPCGYVAPAYYCKDWLPTFTAGFLTTCGLENVGVPCEENGEKFVQHGTIANQPCERAYWTEDDDYLMVHMLVKDETLFGRKLRMERTIKVSKKENEFDICDKIINTGDTVEPVEILYHMNMGYPLLDEDSEVQIPAEECVPRDADAADGAEFHLRMDKPTPGYKEKCYYYKFRHKDGMASIYQPKADIGLSIHFDTESQDCFTEWKMMGVRDYVLGLECGNCYPDGRVVTRENGLLKSLNPGESKVYEVKVKCFSKK